MSNAGPGAVAKDISLEPRFAVYYFESALFAGTNAIAAPIAKFFVNYDYVAYCCCQINLQFLLPLIKSVCLENSDMT